MTSSLFFRPDSESLPPATLNNPFSVQIRGAAFDSWVDNEMGDLIRITDAKPEMVWVDLETTGLDTNKDVTLELGIILTDAVGRICRDGVASWLVYDLGDDGTVRKDWGKSIFAMPDFVREMHVESGLIEDIGKLVRYPGEISIAHPARVAADAYNWLVAATGGDPGKMVLSGSSPHFDRGFLAADMPTLLAFFHYRDGADVSGLRELAKMHYPKTLERWHTPKGVHRTIPDLINSIRLYRHLLLDGFIMSDKEIN